MSIREGTWKKASLWITQSFKRCEYFPGMEGGKSGRFLASLSSFKRQFTGVVDDDGWRGRFNDELTWDWIIWDRGIEGMMGVLVDDTGGRDDLVCLLSIQDLLWVLQSRIGSVERGKEDCDDGMCDRCEGNTWDEMRVGNCGNEWSCGFSGWIEVSMGISCLGSGIGFRIIETSLIGDDWRIFFFGDTKD